MARLNVALLRALDNNANPVSGGKLYVYQAGTTTPVTTYSDAGLTTVHAHPVIADAFGFFTEIYLPAGSYKVSVTDARDVTLDEADNIDVANVIQVYSSRDVSSATEAATLPEGTVVTIAGREYRVAAAKTGNASAMSDLGVAGLVPAGEADLAHFGVTYDAVYTGGRWTGTDATAALQRAADWMAVSRAPVYVTGEAVVTHRDGRNFNAVTVGTWCHWIGKGKGLIGFDFNPAEVVSGNGDKNFTLFGVSDSETADEDTVIARETFRMTKMVIRGLFAANPRGRRQHILRLMGYEEVIVEDCNIQDVSGNFSRSDFNGRWVTKGGYYKNIASGVVRSRYTSQIKVVDAVFENIHDDVIDPHSGEPTIDQPAEPVRFDLYVAGCSFLHCKGINVIGGVSVRIIGNAFYWCLGPISVWARSSDTDEGQGVNHGVFIIGNEILDPFRNLDYTGSDDNTPLIPTAFLSNTNQAILLGGADPEAASGEVAPRAWNSTNGNFNLPYSPFANLKAGAMWARDQQNGTSGHASAFFFVCNNTIRRTRPNATFAFNQGFGPIASKYGDTTISLDSNSYSEEGITILPRMINFHVCGNQVSGIKRPIYFEDDQSDKAYINGLVSDNILEDFYYGVSRAFGNKVHWDVTFRGNKLSGDPFWRSPSRVAGGGWSDPTGLSYDYTIGIHLVEVRYQRRDKTVPRFLTTARAVLEYHI